MSVHAWVPSPEDIEHAARRGVLSYVTEGEAHEHILAAPEAGSPPAGSCVVLPREDDAWLDGFTAPVGDTWRDYVHALASTALRRAGELGYRYLRTDAYPFGAATIEPLEALGFGPEPGPPHYESNRIWRAETLR